MTLEGQDLLDIKTAIWLAREVLARDNEKYISLGQFQLAEENRAYMARIKSIANRISEEMQL